MPTVARSLRAPERPRFRLSRLARDTGWLTAGQLVRSAIQAVAFVLVARTLGARGYGAFAGVVALVAVASPFVGLGTENLLVKHVARRPESLAEQWGRAIWWTTITAVVFGAAATAIAHLTFPHSIGLGLVAAVVVADMWLARLISAATRLYQAIYRVARVAQLFTLLSAARLAAALAMVSLVPAADPATWALLYVAATAIATLISAGIVAVECGAPRWSALSLKGEWREGLYFSLGLSATRISIDVDKTMLAQLGSLAAAGIYSAAYRIVDVATTPVQALLTSLYASFFSEGAKGPDGPTKYLGRLLPSTLIYTGGVAIVLYALAPIMPLILGPQFADSIPALRWLAAVPILYGIHRLHAQLLTGADRQGIRTFGEALAAAMNAGLNLWLIPAYSWKGAVWATLSSESLLVAYMTMAFRFRSRLPAPTRRVAR